MDARHLASQLRGDRRIAVAIAPDPRAPAQEGRCSRRPRPAQSGVAGEPTGAVPAASDPGSVHRAIEGPVNARHGPKERFVEEGQGCPDLVDRGRGGLPHRRGPPQQADLLAQLALDLGLFEKPVAAPQRGQHRAPAGFSGMGGQYRRDTQPPQQLLDPIGRPVALAEPVDRRIRGAFVGPGRPLGSIELTNLVALLAQIDELEIQAECVGQRLGLVDGKRLQLGRECFVGSLVACLAESDRAKAAPFDQLEQLRAALLRDHLAQQRAEELHLPRKRIGRAARTNGPGLGMHGGVHRGGVARGAGPRLSWGSAIDGHVPGAYSDGRFCRPQGRRPGRGGDPERRLQTPPTPGRLPAAVLADRPALAGRRSPAPVRRIWAGGAG